MALFYLLKYLFIAFLVLWLISRVGGFLVRLFLGNLVKKNQGKNFTYTYDNRQRQQKPADGNVHIDFSPKDKANKDGDFKGGDYIDYEEVK